MTDKELNLAAKPRGHKSPIMLNAFRTGYTAACNGKGRDEYGLYDAPREIKAWQDGWDYLAESQQQSVVTGDEHTITVHGLNYNVTVQPIADGGFECLLRVDGKPTSAYGDTVEAALDAASDRIMVAATEKKARENDPKTMECGLDVEAGGATYEVIQRDYKSGRFDLRVAAFPEITLDGTEDDDQDKALETIAQRIAEHLGVVEARTVDGEPAVVDTTPKPSTNGQPRLLEVQHDVNRLIRALASADDDIIDAKRDLEPYKEALKSAELRREAIVVQLVAAGHNAQSPQLPLVPA